MLVTPTRLGAGKILHQYLGQALEENVSLRLYTLLGVGGVADYLITVASSVELTRAVAAAIYAELPYIVLGAGSAVIPSDTGFPGLVIINRSRELGLLADEGVVIAGSGLPLRELLLAVAAQGLSGLEPLALVAGTVGGAVYCGGEIGNFRMCDFVREVTMVRIKRPVFRRSHPLEMVEIITLPRNKVAPGAGISLNRLREKPKSVVLSVRFQLTHRRVESIMSTISGQHRRKEEQGITAEKQLTSVFTLDQAPERVAGLLLAARIPGLTVGGAKFHDRLPNLLVNSGSASAEEVRRLIDTAKQQVAKSSGQLLVEQVEYIGRW